VGVIKTAGVRILKIFVRILQTKLTPLNPFHLNKNESREMLGIMPPQASPQPQRPPAYGGRKSTIVQPSSAVLIIPLPGIRLLVSASRHAAEWFHISTEKLCYQSQFLIGLAELSILNAVFTDNYWQEK
jgi:hypothetical protein